LICHRYNSITSIQNIYVVPIEIIKNMTEKYMKLPKNKIHEIKKKKYKITHASLSHFPSIPPNFNWDSVLTVHDLTLNILVLILIPH